MNRLTIVLKVHSIEATAKFYENFGFSVIAYVPSEEHAEFAIMKNKDVELMIQEKNSMEKEFSILADKETSGTFTMYITVEDVKALYDQCKAEGLSIARELVHTEDGNMEFGILDNNGYILEFAKRNNEYQ